MDSYLPRQPNAHHLLHADASAAGVQLALDALVQQSKGMTKADVKDLVDHLELLMRDCSQANIQAGKNWIVHHCQTPMQYDLLSRAMVAIAISRASFNEKLHIVYLTNDILSHSERKQQRWIMDAIYPHLVPILRVAYFFPGIDDSQRQRIMKVLEIWRNKEFFPTHVVDTLEANVRRPPFLQPPTTGNTSVPVMPSVASYTYPQVPQQMQSPPQFPPQHQQSHHPTQAQQPPYALQMHQQLPSPHPAPWPSASVSLLPTQPHPYNPPPHSYTPLPFLPTPQQQFAQNSASPIHQPPQQVMQPGFQHLSYQQQPQHPQHPQVMLAYQQPLTPTPGMYHSSHSPPALSSTQAPGPNFVSAQPQLAPEPTHRDVLTRDLPAGLMMSKIEPDAEYYEPLPAYVSIPMKSDAISSTVLEHLAKFLSNSPCVGNGSEITEDNRNNANSIKNEGWGDGCLDDFYKSVAVKRRCAYSKEPVKSQKDSERRGRHSRGSESNSRMRTYARSRSRSRSRSRRRSSLHSYSRSLSRGRSRTRSWSRSPPYRSRNRKFSRSRNRDRSESRNISRSKSRDRSRSRGRESYR